MRPEEKIIINEIRKRNKAVFESIYREYYVLLKTIAYKYIIDEQSCENIIHDLFAHIWKKADHIYFESSIKAYLIQSVKNRCLNYLRDLKIKDKHELLYLESILSFTEEELLEEQNLFDTMIQAINELPTEIAKIIFLKYFEGKKINEIAGLQQTSPNTVKKRLQKAKKLLKNKFASYCEFVMFFL